MNKATISSKGQVTIPVAYRRRWKLAAGNEVQIEQLADGTVQLKPVKSILDLAGILQRRGPAPSVQEMRQAAEHAWAARNMPKKHR